jgi:hypothetical protein
MTIQEKIDQLANAAIRSAPPEPSLPKPATYMAPFEKPKTVALVAATVPVAAPEPAAAVEAPAAAPFKDVPDPELRAQIEEREIILKKRQKRKSLAVTLGALAILGSAGLWCHQSPKARAEIGALIPALRQSVDDVKMIGSITKKYDEQLEKIAVHGEHINEATRAMGIDPASVSPEGNAEIEAEMEKMMGEEGPTTAERDRALKEKFGVIGKLAGRSGKPAAGSTMP